eukprot:m.56400 g.56400  ORF g.56400 m.56400 type:complete len:432 (+) comp34594_c0_seq2:103-1398(+)
MDKVSSGPVEGKGRGYLAVKSIKRGDLIGREDPFVFVVDQKHRTSLCHQCLENSQTLSRCSKCKVAFYCGRKCQQLAWSGHKLECRRLCKIKPKVPTESVRFLARLLQQFKNLREQDLLKQLCCHANSLKSKKQQQVFFRVTQTLLEFMDPTLEVDSYILADLYRKIVCNSFSICNGEMQPIGVGLFLKFSLLNHCCHPNCVVTYCGPQMQVRAVRQIEVGEEVTISYVPVYQPIERRREALLEQYSFLCSCSGCESEEALSQNKIHTTSGGNRQEKDVSLAAIKTSVERSEETVVAAERLMQTEEYSEALSLLESCISSSGLHSCSYFTVQCLDKAMDACIETQQWKRALEYALKTIEPYRLFCSPYDPLLAVQLLKVGKLQLHLNMGNDATHSINAALSILEVTHGIDHCLSKECRQLAWQATLTKSGQ